MRRTPGRGARAALVVVERPVERDRGIARGGHRRSVPSISTTNVRSDVDFPHRSVPRTPARDVEGLHLDVAFLALARRIRGEAKRARGRLQRRAEHARGLRLLDARTRARRPPSPCCPRRASCARARRRRCEARPSARAPCRASAARILPSRSTHAGYCTASTTPTGAPSAGARERQGRGGCPRLLSSPCRSPPGALRAPSDGGCAPV